MIPRKPCEIHRITWLERADIVREKVELTHDMIQRSKEAMICLHAGMTREEAVAQAHRFSVIHTPGNEEVQLDGKPLITFVGVTLTGSPGKNFTKAWLDEAPTDPEIRVAYQRMNREPIGE